MEKELLEQLNRTLVMPHKDDDFKERVLRFLRTYEEDQKKKSYMITINWNSNSHSVEELQPVLAKVLSKKWINKYSLTHEQRGEILPLMGKGYHVHLLVQDVDKIPSQVHREVYNTVKDYVGNKKHVDVQLIKNCWLQDKLDYIAGKKFDSDKHQKLAIDEVFRKTYRLERSSSHTPLQTNGG